MAAAPGRRGHPSVPLSEKFSREANRVWAAGHGGLPWTLRGSPPMRDDATR